MSEGLAGVIIVCVTLVCITLVISLTKLITIKEARPKAEPEERSRWESSSPPPVFEYEHTERKADPDRMPAPGDDLPLPVDPARPPTVKAYRPRPGSTQPPPRCVCHQLPVRPGEKVLWWPMPDSEEIRVFCQRGEDQ